MSSLIQETSGLGRRARKRLEAAQIRAELDRQATQRQLEERLMDARNRRSERLPMPRPGSVHERLGDGLRVYVLLDWWSGKKVGKLSKEPEKQRAAAAV